MKKFWAIMTAEGRPKILSIKLSEEEALSFAEEIVKREGGEYVLAEAKMMVGYKKQPIVWFALNN